MAKEKQLDWQQFEEQLAGGKDIEELLGLTESNNTHSEGAIKETTSSQNAPYLENITVQVSGASTPLKFFYPISNYMNMEKPNRKQDDLLLNWPVLPLKHLLPDCFSSEDEQLIYKELGVKIETENK